MAPKSGRKQTKGARSSNRTKSLLSRVRRKPIRSGSITGIPTPRQHAVFGPVTSIATAPVSIGNSICGSAPVLHPIRDGMRVQGRDFMFQLDAISNSKTDWAMVGGCPLIPHAFVASTLRSYSSIYAEFIIHGLSFHFVSAMPSSAVGDIMFYVNKNRGNALLDTTNSNFMSVVLSDPNTVLGPLWHNNTATYKPTLRKYPTDIFNDEDLMHQGPGELFVYMKTSANSGLGSAGYVLVDFDISFTTLQTSPRDLTFPVARLKYAQYGVTIPASSVTLGSPLAIQTNGARLDSTASSLIADSSARIGDIYKVIFMPDYGAFVNCTVANLFLTQIRAGLTAYVGGALTIDDGFTCFAVMYSNDIAGACLLYPSLEAARAQTGYFEYGFNGTGVAFNIPSYFSLVGSVVTGLYQSNF